MQIASPSIAVGYITAAIRIPSKAALTIPDVVPGIASLLPTPVAKYLIAILNLLDTITMSDFSKRPLRSTKIESNLFMQISEIDGSSCNDLTGCKIEEKESKEARSIGVSNIIRIPILILIMS